MLGVDGDDRRAGRLRKLGDELATDDQRLLVGQREVDALTQRRDRRDQAGRADDRVEDQVALAVGDQCHEPIRSAQHLPVGPCLGGSRGSIGISQRDSLDAMGPRLLEQGLPRAPGAQSDEA